MLHPFLFFVHVFVHSIAPYQIVMEGFLSIKLRPWLRRLITRGTAIIPAAAVAAAMGREGVAQLLVLSQV